MADKALPRVGELELSPMLQTDTTHHPVNHCHLHHLASVDAAVGQGFFAECDQCYGGFNRVEGGSPSCPLFVSTASDGRTGQGAPLRTQEMCPSQPGICRRAGSCSYPCPWEPPVGGAGDDTTTQQHVAH